MVDETVSIRNCFNNCLNNPNITINKTELEDNTHLNWTKALQVTSLFILSCLGLILNGLALYTFYQRRSLLSSSRKFIINQMVANFLVCLLLLPLTASCVVLDGWPLGGAACQMSGILHITLITACTLSLMFIATDRYMSIIMAMRYTSLMKNCFVSALVAISWILGIAIGVGPVFNWNSLRYDSGSYICTLNWATTNWINRAYAGTLFVVAFLVPLLVMSVVYIKLFFISHLSGRKLRENCTISRQNSIHDSLYTEEIRDNVENDLITSRLRVPTIGRSHSSDSVINYSHETHQTLVRNFSLQIEPKDNGVTRIWTRMSERHRKRWSESSKQFSIYNRRRGSLVYQLSGIFHKDNKKAAKTGLLIMLSFIICWTPYFVLNLLRSYLELTFVKPLIYFVVMFLAYSNCMVNPVIYVFRNKSVRRQLLQTIRRWRYRIQNKCYRGNVNSHQQKFNSTLPHIVSVSANPPNSTCRYTI